jgi:hypothetical protein
MAAPDACVRRTFDERILTKERAGCKEFWKMCPHPYYARASEFLIWARRRMVNASSGSPAGQVGGPAYTPFFLTSAGRTATPCFRRQDFRQGRKGNGDWDAALFE